MKKEQVFNEVSEEEVMLEEVKKPTKVKGFKSQKFSEPLQILLSISLDNPFAHLVIPNRMVNFKLIP